MAFKYNEEKILAEVREYIVSTYGQHYADGDGGLQLMDWFDALDDAIPYCRTGAIKYISRFGKKDGFNKKDLLKAIHLLVFMLHFCEDKFSKKVQPMGIVVASRGGLSGS